MKCRILLVQISHSLTHTHATRDTRQSKTLAKMLGPGKAGPAAVAPLSITAAVAFACAAVAAVAALVRVSHRTEAAETVESSRPTATPTPTTPAGATTAQPGSHHHDKYEAYISSSDPKSIANAYKVRAFFVSIFVVFQTSSYPPKGR